MVNHEETETFWYVSNILYIRVWVICFLLAPVTAPVDASSEPVANTYVPPQPTITSSAPAPTTVFSELVAKAGEDNRATVTQSGDAKVDQSNNEDDDRIDRIESDFLLDSLKKTLPDEKEFESFDQLSNLIDQVCDFIQLLIVTLKL